jgi:hypothetical protein
MNNQDKTTELFAAKNCRKNAPGSGMWGAAAQED